jgi:LPXTG-motif cell wall-anchored protein
MNARTSRKRTTALALAICTLLASFAGTAMLAIPAQADSPEVSHTPQHVWVDPTVRNADGNYEWSFRINLPEVTEQAVIGATAVQFTNGVVHCQAPQPVDGGILTCEGTGDAIPGDYTVDVELRVLAGTLYTWEVPLTVCPLTGCSDLFSFTVSPNPIVIWAGDTRETHIGGTYNFNVLWNFGEIKFLDDLRDAQGIVAAGLYDPLSEPAKDGAQFGYRGYFTQPGYYSSTVIVLDEFGGEHSADFTVRVCTLETCADLLALPDTGVNTLALLAAGTFAGLTLATGSFMLIVRRRRS